MDSYYSDATRALRRLIVQQLVHDNNKNIKAPHNWLCVRIRATGKRRILLTKGQWCIRDWNLIITLVIYTQMPTYSRLYGTTQADVIFYFYQCIQWSVGNRDMLPTYKCGIGGYYDNPQSNQSRQIWYHDNSLTTKRIMIHVYCCLTDQQQWCVLRLACVVFQRLVRHSLLKFIIKLCFTMYCQCVVDA